MTDTPHPSHVARARVSGGVSQPTNLPPFVVGLRAPPPASAYARAMWRTRASTQPGTAPTSRGLLGATSYPRAETYEHGGAPSSCLPSSVGIPSTAQSRRGPLFTPTASPSTSRLYPGRDGRDVPDIGRPLIRARAPRPALDHPSPTARDTAVGGTINYIVAERPTLTTQGYELSIDILTEEGNYNKYKTHIFLVDTGSDDTFAFGDNPLKVDVSNYSGVGFEPRVHWLSSEVTSGVSHTGLAHYFNPEFTDNELRQRGPIGRMKYADGAVAHLGLLTPRTCVLHGYDWTREQSHQVHLYWAFGVAFAVDGILFGDTSSGILGLGLTGVQHAYMGMMYPGNQRVAPPSFLTMLDRKVGPVPAHRRGEKTAIYFCLRMPPELYADTVLYQSSIQSWMSFNTWPCNSEPEWNPEKIIVCQQSDPIRRRWEVYLRSIKFVRVDAGVQRPIMRPPAFIPGTELNFVNSSRPRGVHALLDTGTSITQFPLHIVQTIHEKLFGGTTTIKGTDKRRNFETYVIPPDSWTLSPETKIQVVYEFEGQRGPVTVHGPFETFFYQRNTLLPGRPAESLIYPGGPSDVILGLNFFQSMYISLHKSTDGLDFVRMAGQWPECITSDLRRFHVPGVSSS